MASAGNEKETAEFEVSEVLDDRRRNGIRQLLIRWAGYPIEEASWEPYSDLSASIQKMPVRKRSTSKTPSVRSKTKSPARSKSKTPSRKGSKSPGRKSRSVSRSASRGRPPGSAKAGRKSTPAKRQISSQSSQSSRSRSRERMPRKASPGGDSEDDEKPQRGHNQTSAHRRQNSGITMKKAKATARGAANEAMHMAKVGAKEGMKLAKVGAKEGVKLAKYGAKEAKLGAQEVRRRALPLVEQRVLPPARRAISKTRVHLRRYGRYYFLIAALLLISFVIYRAGGAIQKSLKEYMKH